MSGPGVKGPLGPEGCLWNPPTMVERVMLALENELKKQWPVLNYEPIARAAITAMREPTEAMFVGAVKGMRDVTKTQEVCDIWRAMIDAALEEK